MEDQIFKSKCEMTMKYIFEEKPISTNLYTVTQTLIIVHNELFLVLSNL